MTAKSGYTWTLAISGRNERNPLGLVEKALHLPGCDRELGNQPQQRHVLALDVRWEICHRRVEVVRQGRPAGPGPVLDDVETAGPEERKQDLEACLRDWIQM